MNRIVVYSNCTFSYTGMHDILCDKYPGLSVIRPKADLDIIDADFIILIINECNLLQYSEFLLTYCKHLPYAKFIIVGEVSDCNLFNAILGCQYKSIDIRLPMKELKAQCGRLMLENEISLKMVALKNMITPSEIEVIKMLSTGFSLSQVAALKKRSLKTISHHKCSFFRKLGLENRTSILLRFSSGGRDSPTFISKTEGGEDERSNKLLEDYTTDTQSINEFL
ncbi:response regulator transcription factor [Serratia fonticola]|uniref:helix-turn-helix domain-containing protein n=1 Tax=Serratia fonticola TaxID=47917 RepID=UPI00157532B9|nr:LuxR C-terminal-related transcriptional regulator [Serratia fonticola]NTY85626.1 response regulator transcription factor [Serratia fonticola]NTZ11531.1 response regulator transcription factor [Serratia fonticola]